MQIELFTSFKSQVCVRAGQNNYWNVDFFFLGYLLYITPKSKWYPDPAWENHCNNLQQFLCQFQKKRVA